MSQWIEWDPKEHKRGRLPQCSKPGCVKTPAQTRVGTRVRLGEKKPIRHAFCDEHAREEQQKETAST